MCSSLSRKEKPTVTRAVSLATRWHIWDLRFSILDWRCDPRAHVMPCHNHYDLMAVATPGEGGLGYLQDNRKVSHVTKMSRSEWNGRRNQDMRSIYA